MCFQLPDAHVEAEEEEQEVWVNALLGRIFWDFLGEKYWSDLVSKKIQMKLSKIKVTNLETCTSHVSLSSKSVEETLLWRSGYLEKQLG